MDLLSLHSLSLEARGALCALPASMSLAFALAWGRSMRRGRKLGKAHFLLFALGFQGLGIGLCWQSLPEPGMNIGAFLLAQTLLFLLLRASVAKRRPRARIALALCAPFFLGFSLLAPLGALPGLSAAALSVALSWPAICLTLNLRLWPALGSLAICLCFTPVALRPWDRGALPEEPEALLPKSAPASIPAPQRR